MPVSVPVPESRETYIQKKIKAQLLDAKAKSKAKDKQGAMFALKRKKMFEGEVNKLNGARMTLESQVYTHWSVLLCPSSI